MSAPDAFLTKYRKEKIKQKKATPHYMNQDIQKFLSLPRLPARLDAQQAAWILGCQPEHMSLLVSRRLVKYLGNPQQSATKYFAQSEIQEIADNPKSLHQITEAIYKYWKEKNANRRNKITDWEHAA